MFRYDTFQQANNKSADQIARMRRLVCDFVVRQIFSRRGPSIIISNSKEQYKMVFNLIILHVLLSDDFFQRYVFSKKVLQRYTMNIC